MPPSRRGSKACQHPVASWVCGPSLLAYTHCLALPFLSLPPALPPHHPPEDFKCMTDFLDTAAQAVASVDNCKVGGRV